ncbi:hypothetical protein [Luedemannella flava]
MMLPLPPDPDDPIEVTCAATYRADHTTAAYAFVFRVDATGTRFTIYAPTPNAYRIDSTYRLTICEPDEVPLWLPADEAEFLMHCLDLVQRRWADAIAEATAAAARPPVEQPAERGHINVEPSPAGYRTVAARFADERDRVARLREHLGHLLVDLPDPHGDVS